MIIEAVVSPKPPAGAAVLQENVTGALRRSALIELARHGYAGLSLGAIARRARVGKPAIYRRWTGKDDLIADLLVEIGMPIVSVDDLGSLAAELREYAVRSISLLRRPLARAILPDLYSQMSRNSKLASLIRSNFQEPKRERARALIDRAVARGEICETVDTSLALDFMAGPLYWRLVVLRGEADEQFVTGFTRMTLAALKADV